MPTLEMLGSFTLSPLKIDEVITRKSPGNFALGSVENKVFYVRYIGRADEDLNAILKSWVNYRPDCNRFKFSYAASMKAAFLKHCDIFHAFSKGSGLSETDHPDRPEGTDWTCPLCDYLSRSSPPAGSGTTEGIAGS